MPNRGSLRRGKAMRFHSLTCRISCSTSRREITFSSHTKNCGCSSGREPSSTRPARPLACSKAVSSRPSMVRWVISLVSFSSCAMRGRFSTSLS